MSRRTRIATVAIVLAVTLVGTICLGSATVLAGPQDYTFTQVGTIPIILTAPHGGDQRPPDVTIPRQCGSTGPDRKTVELTKMLSDLLEKSLGGKPYIVAALFDRKWINANATPNANCTNSSGVPYSDPAAKPYYDYYHQSIRNFVDEIRQKWPNGAVLLDIHGNSDYPNAVIRGTRDGLTVTKLLGRYGWPALIGPNSIFGQLAALLSPNYIVMPSIAAGGNSQRASKLQRRIHRFQLRK